MTESNDVVLYEVDEGIAQVTLNRPDALNAWTPDLGRAYFDRLEEAESSPDVRIIVVTGAGRGFCAGVDFGHLREIYEGRASTDNDPRPQSLPRLLGPSRALDLLLSARTVLAEEAHTMGLVDRLSEPGRVLQDAREYAGELIRYSSPSSMATIKAQVYDDLDRSFGESMTS